MGKYTKITDHLPRTSGNDPNYQAKVEATKVRLLEQNAGYGVSELAAHFVDLRKEKDIIEAHLSDCNLQIEAVSQLLGEQFEDEGLSTLKLKTGAAISIYMEPYAQVVDREAFRQWCIREGLETQLQLPWQTTNSLAKQRLLEGEPEPAGVAVFSKQRIRLTGGAG